ncbi:mitochondrial ribonuclease P protein 1 homolog [Schistocerca piceifrons]|uniref:mitochondrial ribonuclease P protein 1 homolog n=1 Tax=Schistocerca piceifrons TaxID=274613 RepID=UPI001F5ECF84|nr:mitochondrial ribonuclease P protein 1 homolog [Schistocerca piceifrons]
MMHTIHRQVHFVRRIVSDVTRVFKNTAVAKHQVCPHVRILSSVRFNSSTLHSIQKSDNIDGDAASITNGNPDLEKKLKILNLEIDVLRQEGAQVPENVNTEQWKELLSMPTRSKRLKYLKYLWKIEMKELSRLKKKQMRQQERLKGLERAGQEENSHIQYGLGKNTLFLRVYDTTINRFYNSRLLTAMMFGQKLVMDCSYDSQMVKREAQNCAKQLMMAFAENRLHDDPFDLHLCNINRESVTMQELHKFINPLYEDHFPLNLTENSYLDLFPKDKIVYLTPHCREELINYDHEAVYVIGAVVDKSSLGPVSLAKAKREGVKMAKLPLDRYLTWGAGSGKSLTLNQMIQILLEIKTSGDWGKALSFVPRRKLITTAERETAFLKGRNNYEFRRPVEVRKAWNTK